MKLKDTMSSIKKIIDPPLSASEDIKRRVETVTFLVLILLGASIILIVSSIIKHTYEALLGVLIADFILISSLVLAHRGKIEFISQAIPVVLYIIAIFIAFQGLGMHDITLLAFPMIIAAGGLLQGKRGVITTASMGTVSFVVIYLGEVNGLIPGAADFQALTSFDDLLVLTALLWITAAFTYFATHNLTRSLNYMQNGEHALRQANDDLEKYAAILEQRTSQLLTGARVSRAASSILEPDELSQQVVDMVGERFGLYYVSLFLLDEKGQWAILHAGTGEPGQEMLKNQFRLRVGSTSMIGWCVANQKARIALDVGTEAVRFDNPLLPKTRSELALPLISRGKVIGALGIQSEKEAAFSEEDIVIFQAMADQLANAIHNAYFYTQLQRELAQRKRAEKQIRKLNKELEQRVAERTSELQTANERLTALSRLKDEFLANVSHELRTPITSIMLYHSMIESHPENASQYVKTLKRETSRLAHLIEDLLFLSRLDQGRTPFNPTSLDLNRLAEEYVADRTPMARERDLTLSLEENNSLPPALADEKMTSQLLSILLTNALNYTQAGGNVTIRTLAAINDNRNWAGFSVSDTGPGITVEDQKRLFERFFRGKAGRESTAPGTGLGLAIAKEIVHRHGGRIEVQSEGIPGKGTTFFIWLPTAG